MHWLYIYTTTSHHVLLVFVLSPPLLAALLPFFLPPSYEEISGRKTRSTKRFLEEDTEWNIFALFCQFLRSLTFSANMWIAEGVFVNLRDKLKIIKEEKIRQFFFLKFLLNFDIGENYELENLKRATRTKCWFLFYEIDFPILQRTEITFWVSL